MSQLFGLANHGSFVCTTRVHTLHPLVLRSYAINDSSQATYNVKIWQAARATSAAPPFFREIVITEGVSTTRLLDGALRLNNPINEAIREANTLDSQRGYGCVISLGTGLKDGPALKGRDHIAKVIAACVKLATDSEVTATQFLRDTVGTKLDKEGKYFRFQVPSRLARVKLDEWDKAEEVQEYVETYLESMRSQIGACARTLLGE